MIKQEKFVKPAQFAEQKIINAITSKEWGIGRNLLPERELAEFLGITRPTLREVLQRLARDGWITIKHGRPTIINDYLSNGGLGILKSLISNKELSAITLARDWLELRILVLPDLAYKAIQLNRSEIVNILENTPDLNATNEEFARFDWNLQLHLIRHSENSIVKMLYNDLTEIYHKEGAIYFSNNQIKRKTLDYYIRLKTAILHHDHEIKYIIKQIMQDSLKTWENINH
ncbi:MAG: GntR family transcriptional regulator [Bacteroidales bacterium]|nr:GntR family transcriptional regulator [Bacteroidales bacterium]